MKRIVFFFSFLLYILGNGYGQCYCEDCPEPIIFGAPSSVSLNVSGATNNLLGQNGQSLVNVGLYFTHDAAQELSLRLVAPDGSFVDLMIGEGLDFGQNNFFDINFVQCSDAAMPDCTNDAVWNSNDIWDGGPYLGSYFPESGCLEDLTGDINGTWTLEMEDVLVVEDGEMYCFDLTFADGSGISCNSAGCSSEECLVQGGSSQQPNIVTAPEGDPALIIDYTITYDDCEIPQTGPNYLFIYVIYDATTNELLEIQQGTVDLTTYPEGYYIAQGFSILASDLPLIENLVLAGANFFEIFTLINNGDLCADNTELAGQIYVDNCVIDFTGILEFENLEVEAGDPVLDTDWFIIWDPAEPDFSIFGLYYVVREFETGILVGYFNEDDFTNLPPGNYRVTVLVYLLTEEPNLPPVDGVSTYNDLNNLINFDGLCGYLFGLNTLFLSEPCDVAEDAAGVLEQDDITAVQNSPLLDPDWEITFSGADPDPAIYGFYFLVVNADTDQLIAYYTTDDFTLLLEGNYYVVVIYYLLSDQQELPPPNGTNTFLDVVNLINNGDLCATYFGFNTLTITPPCEADAGSFTQATFFGCQGDSDLILDLTPNYTGSGPDPSEYGYTYVVSQNGIIIAIDPSQDFTSYDVGEYEICGLSYLLSDELLIPSPNGSLTTNDILTDISNEVYCADLTDVCATLTISEVPIPIFTGPTEVCAGEEVEYVVENFSGNNDDYLYIINQGSFLQFINDEQGTLSVIWAGGPGNICVIETQNGCESEEVCITVDVLPQPVVTIEGFEEVCPGTPYLYIFTPVPSGSEVYDVTVSGGTIINLNANSALIEWTDLENGFITATLLGGPCPSEEAILEISPANIPDFPNVSIPVESCLNTGLAIPDVNDPDIIDWTWTATNADILIANGFVNFTWENVGLAEICLEITSACGTEEMCYDVDVLPFPEPSIDPVFEFCSLTFDLNAIPGFGNSWLWTSPGSGGSVSYSDQTNFETQVTVTAPGTYTFILQEFSNPCSGSVETTVTVTDGLSTTNPTYSCDDEGNYTVTFAISDGTAPFSVNGNVISGTIFVSGPISSGSSYVFTVEDQEGCTAEVVGVHDCPCISNAGTMNNSPISICISSGEEALGIHNADATFDFNDDGDYVLHTGNGSLLGIVVGVNDTGLFGFDPTSMIAGQTYYISYIVGDDLGGVVDLNDPCLSVAIGQPVIFYEDPIVEAGPESSTCEAFFNLTENAGIQNGIWTVNSQPTGANATIQLISGSSIAEVDITGTYTFAVEVIENGCSGFDLVEVEFLDGPGVSNLTTQCDGDTYEVSFEITGGSEPFFVNGELVDGNTFVSDAIPSGDVYTYVITDVEDCASEVIQGTEVCNCTTDAGTMSSDELFLCAVEGSPIVATFNDDATFDGNDTGVFILHTGSSNILGDIIDTDDEGEFVYDSDYGSDVTLYISYVVGNELGGTVDLNDECLSVSVGQPVVIEAIQQVDAGEYQNICGFEVELNANDLGVPGSWVILSAPADANVTFENEANAGSGFSTDLPGAYSLIWNPNGSECVLSDTTTFQIESELDIEETSVLCSEDLLTFDLEVVVFGGVAPYFIDGSEVQNPIAFTLIESGTSYSFVLLDSRGCELVIEGSSNCECTNEAGTMDLTLLEGCISDTLVAIYNEDGVLDSNDEEYFILHTSSADTLGDIIAVSDTPSVVFGAGMVEGTTYYLSHVIGNETGGSMDLSDPCLKVATGQPIVFYGFPEVSAGEDQNICGLSVILEGASEATESEWAVIENPFGAIIDIDVVDLTSSADVSIAGSYIFEFAATNGYCISRDTVTIDFDDQLNYSDLTIDCGTDGYLVSFVIEGGSSPYSVNGEALSGNAYISELIPLEMASTFTIEDDGLCENVIIEVEDVCACESDAGTMDQNLIELCENELINLGELSNGDFMLGEDDEVFYVIHDGQNAALGAILGIYREDENLEVSFEDLQFQTGITYYVSLVVATEDILMGNFDDPCIAVSIGTPLRWRAFDSASLVGDIQGCEGEMVEVPLVANGEIPFEIVVSDGLGYEETILVENENTTLEYVITAETTIRIGVSNNEACLQLGIDEITISILEIQKAELESIANVCKESEFGSVVELSDLIVSGFSGGSWTLEGELVNETVDFEGFEVGIYELVYEIELVECDLKETYTVQVEVEECECPTFGIETEDVTCFGLEDGSVEIVVSEGVDVSDFEFRLNEEEVFEMKVEGLDAGEYELEVTDGEDCIEAFNFEILEPDAVQISLGEDMEADINDPVVIEAITNLIESEIGSISWESLQGIFNDNDLFLNTSFATDDIISITITDENGCQGMDELMVRVNARDYVIPNAINPFSNTGNDRFRIFNSDIIESVVSMAVFDRWGNAVYRVENVEADSELASWDGTFGGSRVVKGVYVYRFVLMIAGEEEVVIGDLTVF